jgi:hypothetical protein
MENKVYFQNIFSLFKSQRNVYSSKWIPKETKEMLNIHLRIMRHILDKINVVEKLPFFPHVCSTLILVQLKHIL